LFTYEVSDTFNQMNVAHEWCIFCSEICISSWSRGWYDRSL